MGMLGITFTLWCNKYVVISYCVPSPGLGMGGNSRKEKRLKPHPFGAYTLTLLVDARGRLTMKRTELKL